MRTTPQLPPPSENRADAFQSYENARTFRYESSREDFSQDVVSVWFRRTYPGYTPEDLAEFYRRNRSAPAVVVNPENRFATFKMRMVGLAANYAEVHEIPGTKVQRAQDRDWIYAIAGVGALAAMVLLVAGFLSA